ncbi:aminoglycoside 6-adenylyltransferase [Sphingobacterium chungjuense]|uniref:aminoglycoside 6-adenylyltransferase n=1 Tax=Sphingobacterium chungjuense TaxID=2675553 RepID=UPI003744A1B7
MSSREILLDQITLWVKRTPEIRIMLLTSSMVSEIAVPDEFSDLDIELVVSNSKEFLKSDNWLGNFGKVIAKISDNENSFEGRYAIKMVLYDNDVKVDFKVYSIPAFEEEVNRVDLPMDWDIGYKVLVDKDQLTNALKPATYNSAIIKKPDSIEFSKLLNDIWWDMTYVAKCLKRDEIFYAKFVSESIMRSQYLVPLIEWYISNQNGWKVGTNKHGRFFKKYISEDLWNKITATFSGSDIEENWLSLFAYADITHKLGTELAESLNYKYPNNLEADIRKYIVSIKEKK